MLKKMIRHTYKGLGINSKIIMKKGTKPWDNGTIAYVRSIFKGACAAIQWGNRSDIAPEPLYISNSIPGVFEQRRLLVKQGICVDSS